MKRIGTGNGVFVLGDGDGGYGEEEAAAGGRRRENSDFVYECVLACSAFHDIWIGDGFTIVGLQEYFYDQMPDSMKSLRISLYISVMGAASFMSSLLITAVDHFTGKMEKGSWFAKDLNKSRLDLFYWLLAGINGVNLCVYVFVATRYSYKFLQRVGLSEMREELLRSPDHLIDPLK